MSSVKRLDHYIIGQITKAIWEYAIVTAANETREVGSEYEYTLADAEDLSGEIKMEALYIDTKDGQRAAEILAIADKYYQEELIKIPSEYLSLMLDMHEKGIIKRFPKTLESIKSELMRRCLLDDSNG